MHRLGQIDPSPARRRRRASPRREEPTVTYLTNPIISDLIAKHHHRDLLAETETAHRLARADGAARRNWTLVGRTRHLVGAVLVGGGQRLRGVGRAPLPAVPHREATGPAPAAGS